MRGLEASFGTPPPDPLARISQCLKDAAQQPQDLSAGRIGNRPENRVVLLARYCNLLAAKIVTDRLRMLNS
jgi:hypothetical protein